MNTSVDAAASANVIQTKKEVRKFVPKDQPTKSQEEVMDELKKALEKRKQ